MKVILFQLQIGQVKARKLFATSLKKIPKQRTKLIFYVCKPWNKAKNRKFKSQLL